MKKFDLEAKQMSVFQNGVIPNSKLSVGAEKPLKILLTTRLIC